MTNRELKKQLSKDIEAAEMNLWIKISNWIQDNTRKSRDKVITKREEIRVKKEILEMIS